MVAFFGPIRGALAENGLKHRACPILVFPNIAQLLSQITASLSEFNDSWSGKKPSSTSPFNPSPKGATIILHPASALRKIAWPAKRLVSGRIKIHQADPLPFYLSKITPFLAVRTADRSNG
jgi:hypothetical protein